jgi:hypothetical protein
MRNKNIFIRKETAFSVIYGNNLPVFANVVGYHDGNVHYEVDYPTPMGKGLWGWHYADNNRGEVVVQESGTYIKPLEDFLQRFAPDYDNEYSTFSV